MNSVLFVIIILAILTIAFFFWYGSQYSVFKKLRRDVHAVSSSVMGKNNFPLPYGGKMYIRSDKTGEYLSAKPTGQLVLKNTPFPAAEELFTYVSTRLPAKNPPTYGIKTMYGKYIGFYPAGKVWAASSTIGAEQEITFMRRDSDEKKEGFFRGVSPSYIIGTVSGDRNLSVGTAEEITNTPLMSDTSLAHSWDITREL